MRGGWQDRIARARLTRPRTFVDTRIEFRRVTAHTRHEPPFTPPPLTACRTLGMLASHAQAGVLSAHFDRLLRASLQGALWSLCTSSVTWREAASGSSDAASDRAAEDEGARPAEPGAALDGARCAGIETERAECRLCCCLSCFCSSSYCS